MTRKDYLEAMRDRHSVRQFTEQPLDSAVLDTIDEEIRDINEESGLHIQLVRNEPTAFESGLAHYGKFKGVRNYIVLVGRRNAQLEEECGYYGEKLVLLAQHLGLNSCWCGLTYRKVANHWSIEKGEKVVCVIALGYGATQGKNHLMRAYQDVTVNAESAPLWFKSGVAAALLAPTAMNQQKFYFEQSDYQVTARPGHGFFTSVDLGIAKFHFEIGAGSVNFEWI